VPEKRNPEVSVATNPPTNHRESGAHNRESVATDAASVMTMEIPAHGIAAMGPPPSTAVRSVDDLISCPPPAGVPGTMPSVTESVSHERTDKPRNMSKESVASSAMPNDFSRKHSQSRKDSNNTGFLSPRSVISSKTGVSMRSRAMSRTREMNSSKFSNHREEETYLRRVAKTLDSEIEVFLMSQKPLFLKGPKQPYCYMPFTLVTVFLLGTKELLSEKAASGI
jgi:hypothetical protein